MSSESTHPVLQVPAREVPVAPAVSPQAQAVLAMPRPAEMTWPPLEDTEAVKAHIAALNPPEAATNGPLVSSTYGSASTSVPSETDHIDVDGVPVYTARPEGVTPEDPRVYLIIHGAWVSGGGEMARAGAAMVAGGIGATTWAVDYRMPPEHPYPAPLDDCVTVYRALLRDHRPQDVIIGGMSAGGNMTLAALLRIRDEGLPFPAAVVVNSPVADLTMQGDTLRTNMAIDPAFTDGNLAVIFDLYAPGEDRSHPYLSPVFGDFTADFPPALLTAGTRDFLLSDTVRIHRRLRDAGVPAELHVWEAAPHFFFLGMAPEDLERVRETRHFVDRHWGPASDAS